MSECYTSYKKSDLIKTGNYLLKQQCCGETSCSELAEDLKELQYKCNDTFGEANSEKRDAKGNIEGSLCSDLKDKKLSVLKILDRLNAGTGGKKMRRVNKTKKCKGKTKRLRKNIKKSRKYRRSKK
jgi:hypothetical protein